MVKNDLHSEYGIDCASGILRRRDRIWLVEKVLGLLSCDSRLARHFGLAIPLADRYVLVPVGQVKR